MTSDDFNLDDFIHVEPQPELVPPPSPIAEAEDINPDDFIPETPQRTTPANPEQLVQRILNTVPDANEPYVQSLVAKSSDTFVDLLLSPNLEKRVRLVRDRILRDTFVTIDTIKPYDGRAIRSLGDHGIPLHRERVSFGRRRITKYSFDPVAFEASGQQRLCVPSKIRDTLIQDRGTFCEVCQKTFELLAADHRVPFKVVGNSLLQQEGLAALQLLCVHCNRLKQTECRESCQHEDESVCRSCYWAYPESYTHIAGEPYRRLTLVATTPDQMATLDKLERAARKLGLK